MKIKQCLHCNTNFIYKSSKAKYCSKKCCKDHWYSNNKQYEKLKMAEWYQNNKDIAYKNHKQWTKNNKEYRREYKRKLSKKQYDTDILYKIKVNLRSRLQQALINNYKTGSAVKDLGCSIEQFKKYIESKWQPGMTWDNHSRDGWHIDHIIPLSQFNLSDPIEFKKACHYSNLQPLWAADNLKKNCFTEK